MVLSVALGPRLEGLTVTILLIAAVVEIGRATALGALAGVLALAIRRLLGGR